MKRFSPLLGLLLLLVAAPAWAQSTRIGGQLDDTTTTVCTENATCTIRITSNRAEHVNLRNASGTEIGTAGAPIRTDPTGTTTQPASVVGGTTAHDAAASSVNPVLIGGYSSAAAPTDVSADTEAVRAWYLRNGAQATVLTAAGALIGGDATNGLDVDVTRVIPGTGATNLGKAIDSAVGATDTIVGAGCKRVDTPATITPANGDYNVLQCSALGELYVTTSGSDVAHDAADAGNPVKIGAKAVSSVSGQTAVAANDRTNLFAGLDGVLIIRQHAPIGDIVKAVVGVTDGSSTSLVAAQGSGIRFCATTITVSNSSATNVTVDIRDGTGGSVIWTLPAAANMGGAVVTFDTPLCTTANTAMATDPSAAATTITTSVVGFKTTQ